MKTQTNARVLSALDFYVCFASLGSIGIAVAVLLGWTFGIAALKSLLPGLVTMKPLTALGLLLAAAALWLSQNPDRWQKQVGQLCAALVFIIG